MSDYNQDRSSNVVRIAESEADAITANLRQLRDQVVIAWRERSVILSEEEQDRLHSEIQQTCTFLADLTRHP